jgi:tryptophan-rich sensory protein
MKRAVRAVVCVAVVLGAAAVGSLLTGDEPGEWYAVLRKPAWTPPGWVFGPVWTALYLMMALALLIVWERRGLGGARVAVGLFAAQLALNVAWSGIFFGLRMPGVAFGELVLLWAAILATAVAFWRESVAAGALLLPYLVWVTFAGALNFAVWRLNA